MLFYVYGRYISVISTHPLTYSFFSLILYYIFGSNIQLKEKSLDNSKFSKRPEKHSERVSEIEVESEIECNIEIGVFNAWEQTKSSSVLIIRYAKF